MVSGAAAPPSWLAGYQLAHVAHSRLGLAGGKRTRHLGIQRRRASFRAERETDLRAFQHCPRRFCVGPADDRQMAVLVLRHGGVIAALCRCGGMACGSGNTIRPSHIWNRRWCPWCISAVHVELATVLADSVCVLDGIHAQTDLWPGVCHRRRVADYRVRSVGIPESETKRRCTSLCLNLCRSPSNQTPP